jgi:RNA polymerase sigma factor (sigma-70 family)
MIARRVCYRLKEQKKDSAMLSLEALQAAGVPMPATGELTADEELEIELAHDCVLRAFEQLPVSYQDVYRMRELEGRSAEETAQALGLTVANVKSRLHRARILVRRALDGLLSAA